jgi:hypothetical protein
MGAEKSLAWPGRKQATAIKFGIYSAYSPRSSLHYLARCSNFSSHSKKSEVCPSNQVSAAEMTSTLDENGDLPIVFFSFQGRGGSPTGPDPENKVGDRDTGSPGRPVPSGLHVLGELGQCRARPSRARRSSFKMAFSCNSRDEHYSALIVWPFWR